MKEKKLYECTNEYDRKLEMFRNTKLNKEAKELAKGLKMKNILESLGLEVSLVNFMSMSLENFRNFCFCSMKKLERKWFTKGKKKRKDVDSSVKKLKRHCLLHSIKSIYEE